MSNPIENVKKKIDWLTVEGYQPEDVSDKDLQALFNILAKVAGGHPYHIVQKKDKQDCFFIACNLVLTPQQLSLLAKMGKEKRWSYFWNLRLRLLTHQNLGDFEIKPNPPKRVTEIFISSKPIYYDALTKNRVISTLIDVYKSTMMAIWMLEQTAGVPVSSTESMYV